MNIILAEGINLGLRKMADATNTHTFWELIRIGRWHVEGEAYDRALAMMVEAQAALPMARFWGTDTSASSDGQFFTATEQGEAMNLVNAKYGNTLGLGEAVANQKREGKLLSPDLLAHVSPLGWEHINLTGEYRWPKP